MTHEERRQWLTERQAGIGSSDAPNLLGVGYRTAADVYRSKIDPPDERLPRAGVLRRGIDLETIIAQRYAESLEIEVEPPEESVIVHPARPWQMASLDRVRIDTGKPVELKSTAGFGEQWGPSGTDQVPDGYLVQTQHQMGVVGADCCDLAALDVITWELRVYRIGFDPAFFEFLTAIEAQFWTDHVLTRTPPPAEWGERFEEETRGRMVKGKRVQLAELAAELCERQKELTAIRNEADAEAKALGREIESLLGDAEEGTAGSWKVKRIHVAGGHVEYDREPYTRLDIRPIRGKR